MNNALRQASVTAMHRLQGYDLAENMDIGGKVYDQAAERINQDAAVNGHDLNVVHQHTMNDEAVKAMNEGGMMNSQVIQ